MKLILCDLNLNLVEAWRGAFQDVPEVVIHHGGIFDHTADAIVSPANSFGFMDGGIDLLYSNTFGWQLQEALQEKIRALPFGELLVGDALTLPTGRASIPNLISAPTMRLPMRIVDLSQIRLATRAALRAAREAGFATVLMPGMGTGSGGVDPLNGARQMRLGWNDVHSKPFPVSWRAALAA